MMSVGFTGTARGMTTQQQDRLKSLLYTWNNRRPEFHFGLCVGADNEAAVLARRLGYRLVAHPGPDPTKRGHVAADEVLPEAPFLVRNQHIVDASHVMLAAPFGGKELLRSGTWATIRRARKAGRPLWIIWPDGSVDQEFQERADQITEEIERINRSLLRLGDFPPTEDESLNAARQERRAKLIWHRVRLRAELRLEEEEAEVD